QQFRTYANLILSHRFFSFGYRSSRNVNLPNRSGGYQPPDLQQFKDSIVTQSPFFGSTASSNTYLRMHLPVLGSK
ncbi:MAG: hypothetical protein Q8O25_13740, partial [Sulfurisoma sp.]|nr:hypothetical protein [Sulfurisoma sp.]